MFEFPDKGNINWLLKKRDIASSYYMESENVSAKRKRQDFLANHEFADRSEAKQIIDTSIDQKRRRFSEDSTKINKTIEEGHCYHHMSLDLELNLSPSLIDLNHHHDLSNYKKSYEEGQKKKMMEKGSALELQTHKSTTRVGFDLDEDCCDRGGGVGGGSEEEMVARVCIKCHILVMLCKASPACPNCKFMHSPEDTSLSLLFTPKPTLLA